MIARVRRHFISITMTLLTVMLIVPLVGLNVVTQAMSYRQTRNLLEQIAEAEVAQIEEAERFREERRNQTTSPAQTVTVTLPAQVQTVIVTVTEPEETTTTAASTEGQSSQTAQTPPPPEEPGTVIIEEIIPGEPQPAPTPAPTPEPAPAPETVPVPETTPVQESEPEDEPEPWAPEEPQPQPWQPGRRERQDYYGPWQPEGGINEGGGGFFGETEESLVGAAAGETVQTADSAAEAALTRSALFEKLFLTAQAQTTASESASGTTAAEAQTMPPPPEGEEPPDIPAGEQPMNAEKHMKPGSVVSIDHFICHVKKDGTLERVAGTEEYTTEEAQELVNYVYTQGKDDGMYGGLAYFRKSFDRGAVVVFSDRSAERLLLKKIFYVSILIFLVMEGVVFWAAMLLTRRAMRPIQETFERQRQFISDAGHELKTPLTIISANADVLRDEIGENKWLTYIQAQTERMRMLITDMMNLSKIESGTSGEPFKNFDLTHAVESAALPFESTAFEQGRKFEVALAPEQTYHGDEGQIKQLTAIFIDNAIKYSEEGGEVRVTLARVKDHPVLKVFNTGRGVAPDEKEKIFERFYRADSSRARKTGGYGLGLSIAQSIAARHRLKIEVESEYMHWICFMISF